MYFKAFVNVESIFIEEDVLSLKPQLQQIVLLDYIERLIQKGLLKLAKEFYDNYYIAKLD